MRVNLFTNIKEPSVLDFFVEVSLVITSEREARSEFLLIYTKNLSMSGRPAVVTLLRGLYLWNRKPTLYSNI